MADEELSGGAPVDETSEVEGGQQPAPEPSSETEGGQGEGQADPVEALAVEIGWTPKDKFSGDPEKWKPAAEFIREGRNIQRNYSAENRELKSQIDTIARTTAQIAAENIERKRAELVEQFNQRVEDGDPTGAHKISVELNRLETQAQPQRQAPPAEVQDWVGRNSWYGKDTAATARAQQICDELAVRNVPMVEQLRAVDRALKVEYPEYFNGQPQANGRTAPSVAAPGSRSSGSGSRAKTFNDMPKAAQDVAAGLVERGLLPDKEAYFKYWQMQEGKR